MYISDDGGLYSLKFTDSKQIEEVSNLMGYFLSSIVGSPLILDDEPLNEVSVERFMISEKKN